ncbi:MAG: hypothetical protein M3N51_08615 [Actinomycetota bacterium]|nr:hypothetical protein [Actinomycetota bacterium]
MRAIVGHPKLWVEALRAVASMSPDGWWRHPPFLPRPHPGYLAWRLVTAYGSPEAPLLGHDVIEYLEWRRRQRRLGA